MSKHIQTTPLQVGVKAFLRNKENEYLILKRTRSFTNNGIKYWDIPGGRINPGESLLDALQRELYEETQLKITTPAKLLAAQDIIVAQKAHIVRLTYHLSYEEGIVVPNPKEHSDYCWVTLAELEQLPYDPYLKEIIPLLEE